MCVMHVEGVIQKSGRAFQNAQCFNHLFLTLILSSSTMTLPLTPLPSRPPPTPPPPRRWPTVSPRWAARCKCCSWPTIVSPRSRHCTCNACPSCVCCTCRATRFRYPHPLVGWLLSLIVFVVASASSPDLAFFLFFASHCIFFVLVWLLWWWLADHRWSRRMHGAA